MFKSKSFVVLIVSLAIALIDSIYLTYHHYIVNIFSPVVDTFCSINSYFDCNSVAISKYSSLFGIPSSTIAVFAYATMLILLIGLFRTNATNQKQGQSFAHIVFILMFIVSMGQLVNSLFILKKVCIMCSILYILSIVILVASRMNLNDKCKNIFKNGWNYILKAWPLGKDKFITGLSLGSLLAGVLIAWASDESFYSFAEYKLDNKIASARSAYEEDRVSKLFKTFDSLESVQINTTTAPKEGEGTGNIVLVEFSDFECPACASRAISIRETVKKFSKEITFYYKNYPLDQHCNKNITRAFHQDACSRAYMGVCAKEQGKFWQYHDFAFANQDEISPENVDQFLQNQNLDIKKFKSCMNKVAPSIIKRDIDEATKLKISYTPTLYLNGKKISDILEMPTDLDALIQRLIEEKR